MICYIILHYMVIDETIKCIESILSNESENVKIIVVDNFSPNDTGKQLLNIYSNNSKVDIILNKENSGFAKGNNLGYKYAKDKYLPDFMIVMNNDVELVSENFYSKIYNIFEKENFYILGPDIYSTTYRIHQSPKRLTTYSYNEVEKLNKKFKKNKEITLLLRIKSFLKSNSFLLTVVQKIKEKRKQINYKTKYYNIPLHGSCLIVSHLFIEKEDLLFNPNTFFYYETEILDYICKVKNYKTLYDPTLKVLHHQNVATNVVYNNILQKTLFSNKCNYDSTLEFLNVIKEYENIGG